MHLRKTGTECVNWIVVAGVCF